MKEPQILHNRRGQKAQANYTGFPQISSSLIPHPRPPQFIRSAVFHGCVGAGSCHFGVCRGPKTLVALSQTTVSNLQLNQRSISSHSRSQSTEIATESPAKGPSAAGLLGAGAALGDATGTGLSNVPKHVGKQQGDEIPRAEGQHEIQPPATAQAQIPPQGQALPFVLPQIKPPCHFTEPRPETHLIALVQNKLICALVRKGWVFSFLKNLISF